MKKESDQRFMQFRRLATESRWMTCGAVVTIVSSLLLSACTNYRPLDQGARVPWAKALIAAKGGPLDGNRYRVERGDALSQIASRYDVQLSMLANANNIPPPYVLYPGEVLRIPENIAAPAKRSEIKQTALAPSAPSAPTVQPTKPKAWSAPTVQPTKPVAKPQLRPTLKLQKQVVEGERHVVTRGESLALIAERNKLKLSELVTANNIEPPYQIRPGQELIIPNRETRIGQRKEPVRQDSTETASVDAPAPPLSTEGFMWPVYGDLIGNFEQQGSAGRSGGVNIAIRKGTPVRASENGIVAYAGEALSGYGRLVMLRHAEGYVTLYAHNDVILVREGDVVQRGETIAEAGDSGDVGESQLHFEIRKGTAPIDPTKVLAGLPGRQIGKL